ncbi:MAG: HEAT repeat domain-containing protein, partial [Bryobacteraceae bacterium]
MVRVFVSLLFALVLCGQLPAQPPPPGTDAKQRSKAIRELAKQGSESIPKITPYLADSDLPVRIEAVKALVDIGTQYSLEPLIKASQDSDPEMQIRATDGLVNFYLPGYVKTGLSGSLRRAGTVIKGKFTDTNDQIVDAYVEVRPDVVEALGKVARGGSSMDSRANAARAIGVLRGRAAIPDLLAALHSKDTEVIYEALIAIEKIRDPSTGKDITFLLRDMDDKVQTTALDATGLLRNLSAAPQVRDVLEHARSAKVRRQALATLAMLPEEGNRPYLARYFNSKDDVLRAASAEGYGRLKNPSDIQMLAKAFNSESKMNPRLALAFALVDDGKTDMSEFSPLRYLVNTLNSKGYQGVAQAYLVELARSPQILQALY